MKMIFKSFNKPLKGILDIILIMGITVAAVFYLGPIIIDSAFYTQANQKVAMPSFEYACDETGRIIKDILRDEQGNVYGWIDITYHENGKFKEITEHNERDRIIRNVHYSEQEEFLYWYEIRLDKNGDQISKIKFDPLGNQISD